MLPRVLTALVGAPIVVGAIWWGGPGLIALVVLVAALGIREFYRLMPPETGPLPLGLGVAWTVALVLGGQAASGLKNFLVISGGIWVSGAFISVLWLVASYSGRRYAAAGAYFLAGPLYVGFLLAHSLVLREMGTTTELGRSWLLLAVLVTFATDTGAFATGRALGRHSMAPAISPGKTWEGVAGGFLSAVAVATALGLVIDLAVPRWQVGVAGATVGVLAQCGDLLESKLKRISNVKDAGNIIPGHGGVLDRLDSIVASVPAVYYLVATVFKP